MVQSNKERRAMTDEAIADDVPGLTPSAGGIFTPVDMTSTLQASGYRSFLANPDIWTEAMTISQKVHDTRRASRAAEAYEDLSDEQNHYQKETFKLGQIQQMQADVTVTKRTTERNAVLSDYLNQAAQSGTASHVQALNMWKEEEQKAAEDYYKNGYFYMAEQVLKNANEVYSKSYNQAVSDDLKRVQVGTISARNTDWNVKAIDMARSGPITAVDLVHMADHATRNDMKVSGQIDYDQQLSSSRQNYNDVVSIAIKSNILAFDSGALTAQECVTNLMGIMDHMQHRHVTGLRPLSALELLDPDRINVLKQRDSKIKWLTKDQAMAMEAKWGTSGFSIYDPETGQRTINEPAFNALAENLRAGDQDLNRTNEKGEDIYPFVIEEWDQFMSDTNTNAILAGIRHCQSASGGGSLDRDAALYISNIHETITAADNFIGLLNTDTIKNATIDDCYKIIENNKDMHNRIQKTGTDSQVISYGQKALENITKYSAIIMYKYLQNIVDSNSDRAATAALLQKRIQSIKPYLSAGKKIPNHLNELVFDVSGQTVDLNPALQECAAIAEDPVTLDSCKRQVLQQFVESVEDLSNYVSNNPDVTLTNVQGTAMQQDAIKADLSVGLLVRTDASGNLIVDNKQKTAIMAEVKQYNDLLASAASRPGTYVEGYKMALNIMAENAKNINNRKVYNMYALTAAEMFPESALLSVDISKIKDNDAKEFIKQAQAFALLKNTSAGYRALASSTSSLTSNMDLKNDQGIPVTAKNADTFFASKKDLIKGNKSDNDNTIFTGTWYAVAGKNANLKGASNDQRAAAFNASFIASSLLLQNGQEVNLEHLMNDVIDSNFEKGYFKNADIYKKANGTDHRVSQRQFIANKQYNTSIANTKYVQHSTGGFLGPQQGYNSALYDRKNKGEIQYIWDKDDPNNNMPILIESAGGAKTTLSGILKDGNLKPLRLTTKASLSIPTNMVTWAHDATLQHIGPTMVQIAKDLDDLQRNGERSAYYKWRLDQGDVRGISAMKKELALALNWLNTEEGQLTAQEILYNQVKYVTAKNPNFLENVFSNTSGSANIEKRLLEGGAYADVLKVSQNKDFYNTHTGKWASYLLKQRGWNDFRAGSPKDKLPTVLDAMIIQKAIKEGSSRNTVSAGNKTNIKRTPALRNAGKTTGGASRIEGFRPSVGTSNFTADEYSKRIEPSLYQTVCTYDNQGKAYYYKITDTGLSYRARMEGTDQIHGGIDLVPVNGTQGATTPLSGEVVDCFDAADGTGYMCILKVYGGAGYAVFNHLSQHAVTSVGLKKGKKISAGSWIGNPVGKGNHYHMTLYMVPEKGISYSDSEIWKDGHINRSKLLEVSPFTHRCYASKYVDRKGKTRNVKGTVIGPAKSSDKNWGNHRWSLQTTPEEGAIRTAAFEDDVIASSVAKVQDMGYPLQNREAAILQETFPDFKVTEADAKSVGRSFAELKNGNDYELNQNVLAAQYAMVKIFLQKEGLSEARQYAYLAMFPDTRFAVEFQSGETIKDIDKRDLIKYSFSGELDTKEENYDIIVQEADKKHIKMVHDNALRLIYG